MTRDEMLEFAVDLLSEYPADTPDVVEILSEKLEYMLAIDSTEAKNLAEEAVNEEIAQILEELQILENMADSNSDGG